jgi:hypothetical protein
MAKIKKSTCEIAGANLASNGLKKATYTKAGSTLGKCSAKAKRLGKTKSKK